MTNDNDRFTLGEAQQRLNLEGFRPLNNVPLLLGMATAEQFINDATGVRVMLLWYGPSKDEAYIWRRISRTDTI